MKFETNEERFKRWMASFGKNKKWDEATQRAADQTRALFCSQPGATISEIQNHRMNAAPIKNQSQYRIVEEELACPPQDDIRQVLLDMVKQLEDVKFDIPRLEPVQVEWIGQKREGGKSPSAPSLRGELRAMKDDCSRDLTMIQVHGGGLFQGDPKSHRSNNAKLVSLTGGRIAGVRYRLAPQNTFPAPLFDLFLVYLSLLYPPAGSMHDAVDPSRVMLVGDSVGGTLIYGLLSILQHLSHVKGSLKFHEHTIEYPIPYPAGSAIMSPASDPLHALPSWPGNAINDLYPPESAWMYPYHPRCELWPANPPRPQTYAYIDALRSPLLTLARMKNWEGLPPMWIALGEESFYDGTRTLARRAAQKGVNVTWLEFEAMPHCLLFAPKFNRMKQATLLLEQWARFCIDCVDGKVRARENQVIAKRVDFATAQESDMLLEDPSNLSFEEIEKRLEQKRQKDERDFWEALRVYTPSKL